MNTEILKPRSEKHTKKRTPFKILLVQSFDFFVFLILSILFFIVFGGMAIAFVAGWLQILGVIDIDELVKVIK